MQLEESYITAIHNMKYIYILMIMLLSVFVKAQNFNEYDEYNYEFSLGGGRIQYYGDVKSNAKYWSGGDNYITQLSIRKHLNKIISIRELISYGKITASDLDEPNHYWQYRNVRFNTKLIELATLIELYPIGNRKSDCHCGLKGLFSPFITLGLGYIHTNPNLYIPPIEDLDSPYQALVAKDNNTLKKSAISIPFGAGLKINVDRRWHAGIEGIYRFTNTDYIDGFAAAGNPTSLDGYVTFSLFISYSFPK